MKVSTFHADDAAGALEQIHRALGPDAVVLNVRRIPRAGFTGIFGKSRIEVLACLPSDGPKEKNAGRLDVRDDEYSLAGARDTEVSVGLPGCDVPAAEKDGSSTRASTVLRSMGLRPWHVERVLKAAGAYDAGTGGARLSSVARALRGLARCGVPAGRGPHIFIGPPGSGKTTALCKWMTQAALSGGATARVWRLDVPGANTAEALAVYCDIMNTPVERAWNEREFLDGRHGEDLLLVDLPGFHATDETACAELNTLLAAMPGASVSLVLNAAYESALLEREARAFARLPISHVVWTHLDEENRWSKLWNIMLGTGFTFSFLSAGQNIPGQFVPAAAELLMPDWLRQ